MYRPIVMCGALVGLVTVAALAAPAPGNEAAEIAGVQAAGVAPEMAIQSAESRLQGRAVSFGLERTATVNAYEVTVATHGALQTMQVDPDTGAVIGVVPAGANSLAADGLPAQAVGRAIAANVTLATAVRNAQNALHGRALEAGYALHDAHLTIEVDVIRNGATTTVTVDPQSGQVMQTTRNDPAQSENQGSGSEAD